MWYFHQKILFKDKVALQVRYSRTIKFVIIMYLEGYVDGCWMNALTIHCMASV
jgi:hypothetical protein